METDQHQPRLTGGTFMVLLGESRRPNQKARASVMGKSDGLNNQELLKALIRIFDKRYLEPPATTFKQNCSAYRSCELAHGTYLPFNDVEVVSRFDLEVTSQFTTALGRMSTFIDRFIDVDQNGAALAKRLLGLVEADTSIGNDQALHVLESGTPVSKAELLNRDEICLDALLLGIWHYIVTQVSDNRCGRATFEYWHERPTQRRSQWKLLPERIPLHQRELTVRRPTNTDCPDADSLGEEATPDEEVVEAEIVDEDPPRGDDGRRSTSAAPTVVFNQYGANSTQVANVQNLYLGDRR